MAFLSLCAIVKDETPYLHEWVRHHVLVGVERFHIYDNESRVPVSKVLAPWVEQGVVTVREFSGIAMQLAAYRDCLDRHGPETHWLGFVDLDEFLFPLEHEDLRELLLEYDDFGGLAVNWCVFGSSGHLRRPKGMQRDLYQERFPLEYEENCLVKCLVQPRKVSEVTGVHHCRYIPGNCCVNERREPVFGPFAPVSVERVRINHYFYRSQQDFCAKLERGRADHEKGVMAYQMERFHTQSREARVPDDSLSRKFPLDPAELTSRPPLRWPRLSALLRLKRKDLLDKLEKALARGDAARATELAKGAVIKDPLSEETWLLLGTCLARREDFPRAMDALQRSIRIRETIEAFFQIFLIHVRRDAIDEARRVALYLRYRMADTPFVENSPGYQVMARSVEAYLGKG